MSTRETEKRLERWGVWARKDAGGLGVNSVLGAMLGGDGEHVEISDDEGIYVDSTVCRLTRKNGEMGRILILTYVNKMTLRHISKKLHCGKSKAAMIRIAAIAWIDSAFDGARY